MPYPVPLGTWSAQLTYMVGEAVGLGVGDVVGLVVGDVVGLDVVGEAVGVVVGEVVGVPVVGAAVGAVGACVGASVGASVGAVVVGIEVGDGVGVSVSAHCWPQPVPIIIEPCVFCMMTHFPSPYAISESSESTRPWML